MTETEHQLAARAITNRTTEDRKRLPYGVSYNNGTKYFKFKRGKYLSDKLYYNNQPGVDQLISDLTAHNGHDWVQRYLNTLDA